MSWLRSTFRAVPRPSTLCSSCARRFYASDPQSSFRPLQSSSSTQAQPTEAPAVQDEISTPPVEGDPAAPDAPSDAEASAQTPPPRRTGLGNLYQSQAQSEAETRNDIQSTFGMSSAPYTGQSTRQLASERETAETHHLHIYATKHNTHLTLTQPNRNPVISVSCGNLGFRKGNRGEYDSAFQLASYVFTQIQERNILSKITHLELVFRGFGVGREAVTKALLGVEGQNLRQKVNRVTDHTRLKFGGTRSRKPRRLG